MGWRKPVLVVWAQWPRQLLMEKLSDPKAPTLRRRKTVSCNSWQGVRRRRWVRSERRSEVREEGSDVGVSGGFPWQGGQGGGRWWCLGLNRTGVAVPESPQRDRQTFRALGSVHVLNVGSDSRLLGRLAASRPLKNARGQEHAEGRRRIYAVIRANWDRIFRLFDSCYSRLRQVDDWRPSKSRGPGSCHDRPLRNLLRH